MKKKLKLILADMDGTLLNQSKKLPPRIEEILCRLQEHDIIFGIASGRQMANLYSYFPDWKEKMFFIAENGSYACYGNQELYYSSMDRTLVKQLITKAKGLKEAWPVLCTKSCAYIDSSDPWLFKECQKYYDSLKIVDDLLEISEAPCKLAICDRKGSEKQSWPLFKAYQGRLEVTVSADIWLDLCNPHQSKGRTTALFQNQRQIKKEETMAFGDYLNDISLLKQAYYSYAMANSHPDLFQYARFTAPACEENGVITTIEQFLNEEENLL